jgi:hypothetical protein
VVEISVLIIANVRLLILVGIPSMLSELKDNFLRSETRQVRNLVAQQ